MRFCGKIINILPVADGLDQTDDLHVHWSEQDQEGCCHLKTTQINKTFVFMQTLVVTRGDSRVCPFRGAQPPVLTVALWLEQLKQSFLT